MSESLPVDLDAYFRRVGWRGDTQPTLATLSELLRAHMSAIPFENLDVLLGRPVRLDLASVQGKLVGARRGGYCFEHATLFGAVIDALGFEVARHAARVTLFVPRTAAPRTHMFLTVALPEGTFVVDPGFGTLAPRVPIPLSDGGRAGTLNETHEMVQDGDQWILRARIGVDPVDAWISTLEEENPADFEMGNHYTSTHPASAFVNRLMMRALTRDGRVNVMNRDVTVWHGDQPQRSQLADRDALRSLLRTYFGFDLPEVERLRVPSIPGWD